MNAEIQIRMKQMLSPAESISVTESCRAASRSFLETVFSRTSDIASVRGSLYALAVCLDVGEILIEQETSRRGWEFYFASTCFDGMLEDTKARIADNAFKALQPWKTDDIWTSALMVGIARSLSQESMTRYFASDIQPFLDGQLR